MSDRFSALRDAKRFFEAHGFPGTLILRGCDLDVVGMISLRQDIAARARQYANDNGACR